MRLLMLNMTPPTRGVNLYEPKKQNDTLIVLAILISYNITIINMEQQEMERRIREEFGKDPFKHSVVTDLNKPQKDFASNEKITLHIPDAFKSDHILLLGLSKRTTSALINGMYYSLGDLNGQSRDQIMRQCVGMGPKSVSEIFDSNIIDKYISKKEYIVSSNNTQFKKPKYISEYIRERFSCEYFDMLIDKYEHEDCDLSAKYKISRQAIHARIDKMREALKEGFKTNQISTSIYQTIMDKVSLCCPLDEEHDFDPIISNKAIIRIFSSIFPNRVKIYHHAILRRQWAFGQDNDIGIMIHNAREYLNKVSHCTKDELVLAASMSPELLEDISFIHHYDNYITATIQKKLIITE